MIPLNTTDEVLEAVGRPGWLNDLVIERLGLDDLIEKVYSLGVQHGRNQLLSETAQAQELSSGPVECRACEGTGTDGTEWCPDCDGLGVRVLTECRTCDGTGAVTAERGKP